MSTIPSPKSLFAKLKVPLWRTPAPPPGTVEGAGTSSIENNAEETAGSSTTSPRSPGSLHSSLIGASFDTSLSSLPVGQVSSPKDSFNAKDAKELLDNCAICLDSLNEGATSTLQCGHTFHADCISGLETYGIANVCPLCRASISPGHGANFERGCRKYFRVARAVKRGRVTWGQLSQEQRRDCASAERLWREAADNGFVRAQFNFGVIFENGHGVERNDAEAFAWYLSAANKGFASAQCNLSAMLKAGRGVDRADDVKAVSWFEKAAKQGFAEAQCNLAIMYEQGRGVERSEEEAIRWYELAASQDSAEALYCLGEMKRDGHGFTIDTEEAVILFQKSAELGHAGAEYALGSLYETLNDGAYPNSSEAVRLFTSAAGKGHLESTFSLGLCYLKGHGTAVNEAKAAKLFRQAAERGQAKAQNNLAYMLLHGQGTFANVPAASLVQGSGGAGARERAMQLGPSSRARFGGAAE